MVRTVAQTADMAVAQTVTQPEAQTMMAQLEIHGLPLRLAGALP